MLIIIGSLVLLGIGWYLFEQYEELGIITGCIGGLVLLISVIALCLNYTQVDAQLAHYEATKLTIEDARNSNLNDNEYLMLSNKILEVNTFIAETKALNEGVLDIFIPDKLTELEPLEFPK